MSVAPLEPAHILENAVGEAPAAPAIGEAEPAIGAPHPMEQDPLHSFLDLPNGQHVLADPTLGHDLSHGVDMGPIDPKVPMVPTAFNLPDYTLDAGALQPMDFEPQETSVSEEQIPSSVTGFFKLEFYDKNYFSKTTTLRLGRSTNKDIAKEARKERRHREKGKFFTRSVMSTGGGFESVAGDGESHNNDSNTDQEFLALYPSSGRALSGISKIHAEISFDGDGPTGWVINVFGRNGLYLDDVYCPSESVRHLDHNMRIMIGGVEFYFVLPSRGQSTPGTMSYDFPSSDDEDMPGDFVVPMHEVSQRIIYEPSIDSSEQEDEDEEDEEEEDEEPVIKKPVKESRKSIDHSKKKPAKRPQARAESAELEKTRPDDRRMSTSSVTNKYAHKKPAKDAKPPPKPATKARKKPESKPADIVEPEEPSKESPPPKDKDQAAKSTKPAKERPKWMDKAEGGELLVNGVDFHYPRLPMGYKAEPPKIGSVGRPPKGGGPFSEKQMKEMWEKWKHEEKLKEEGKDPALFPFQGLAQKAKPQKRPEDGGLIPGESASIGNGDQATTAPKKGRKPKDDSAVDNGPAPDWSKFDPEQLKPNGRTHAVNLYCLLEDLKPLTLQEIYKAYKEIPLLVEEGI